MDYTFIYKYNLLVKYYNKWMEKNIVISSIIYVYFLGLELGRSFHDT